MADLTPFKQQETTDYDDWLRSDQYHNSFLVKPDPALDGVNQVGAQNGLPPIAVSTALGKFLNLLVTSIGAKKIIEVGTLAGYSTLWMAKAIPEDGEIITFELEEKHAKVARENLEKANVSHKVEVVVGPAAESLPKIGGDGTFDLAFIDADKESNLEYFKQAKRLLRTKGVIIVDNVVRNGKVAVPEESNNSIEGVRRLLEYIKGDKEVEGTTIATVGEKGYDGFLYAPSTTHPSLQLLHIAATTSVRVVILILPKLRSLGEPILDAEINILCCKALAQSNSAPGLRGVVITGSHDGEFHGDPTLNSDTPSLPPAIIKFQDLVVLVFRFIDFGGNNRWLPNLGGCCPRLKSLTFLHCTGFTVKAIQTIVETRMKREEIGSLVELRIYPSYGERDDVPSDEEAAWFPRSLEYNVKSRPWYKIEGYDL
ncbi:hypothetical protein M407DRAFT_235618 [Tulasnella calospora MUT 4182]|uniref:Methyltransferase domain-containing protein n=1 Tax=Tulasnella calospora MUT 4182 TaxID=1051891 RepID=A0A0C3Q108_9AGAM|nr:hypothetical protein M407DRAFT_235618 [Tulasnella calospora MUT 4182]